MDREQFPSQTDIAKMLDTIEMNDEVYPETLHVLRWLIESSAEARELHDRLYARRDDEPSLIELARLFLVAETGCRYPEAVYTAHWLIRQSPGATELLRRLERMASAAGLDDSDRDWAVRGLEAHREIDRLLATLDDWSDAGEAITLALPKDYALPQLLNVCRERIGRDEAEERERLEELRSRLLDAARRAAYITDPEAGLRQLMDSLRSRATGAYPRRWRPRAG